MPPLENPSVPVLMQKTGVSTARILSLNAGTDESGTVRRHPPHDVKSVTIVDALGLRLLNGTRLDGVPGPADLQSG